MSDMNRDRKTLAYRKPGIPRALLGALGATLALGGLPAASDDTEIFFGRSSDAFENNPNILFVLDNSGSMSNQDDGATGTRMQRLKSAMNLLLDQSSSYNVGMAAFQGQYGGSAIRYPIGYLESDSSDLCEGGVCPDERVVARLGTWRDDAVQDDDTNAVALAVPSLVMVDADATVEPGTGATVSGSAIASASMSQAASSLVPGSVTSLDGDIDDWFHAGSGYEPLRHAYRFEGVNIPPDATVTEAKIVFTRTAVDEQLGNVSARISAEATAAPLPYTSDESDPDYRSLEQRNDEQARTSVTVPWSNVLPPLAPDATDPQPLEIDSADIAPLLTEVAGLNGWASGGAVSLLIGPSDEYSNTAADQRRFHGVGSTAAWQRPVLHYTYTEAPQPDSGSLSVQAAAHVDEFAELATGATWANTTNSVTNLFHVGADRAPRELGLRFENLGIPAGAEILTARLTLHAAAGTATDAPPEDWTRDPDAAPADPSGDPVDPALPPDPVVDPVDLGAADPTVSLTIAAERSGSPAPFGLAAPLAGRDFGSQIGVWDDLDDLPNTASQSPNFAAVITELVNLPDWGAGDDLVLKLSPASDYDDLADNVRRFLTAAGGVRPTLDITWNEIDTTGDALRGTQTTALRFPRVHVPPGATIKSAKLVFTAAAADDEPTAVSISAERAGASAPLADALNDLGARVKTSAREPWSVEPWDLVGQPYETPDLSRVVEEVVHLSDWCGGNPMTFFVGTGSGKRTAHSFQGNPALSPKLEVVYEPSSIVGDSYCSNASVDVSVQDGNSDAVQTIGGAQDTAASTLGTNAALDGNGAAQTIGVAFRDVQVPQGATIVSAALRLTTREPIVDVAELRVEVQDTDDATSFLPANPSVQDRDWVGDAVWRSPGPVDAGDAMISDDITSLVTATVNRPGWQAGNTMAFRLSHLSGSERHFVSRDSDEATSPDLVIYYESERADPGTTFRENLKYEVNLLRTEGWTPIVSSIYEGARYFRGDDVEYGAQRGEHDDYAKYLRVSHPYSWTGGTLKRPDNCTEANLDSADCIKEEIKDSPVYTSPIQSQCQSNHLVILSDGAATRDDKVQNDVEDLIDGKCDESHANDNEHCGRELANWLSNTDHAPGIDGNQTVNVHSIALALGADPDAEQFLQDLATEGGGGYYPVKTSAELLNAFKNIFINVSKTDASFVSPAVTVSAQNRLKHRDDMYFSLFRPEPTARWGGNLKRYRSKAIAGSTADIVDADGESAVDAATGQFKPGSRSWWSDTEDGGSVLLGGAASQLGNDGEPNATRRVATFTGLAAGGSRRLLLDVNKLEPDNARIDPLLYDLPPQYASDADYVRELVDWARGRDVLDVDGDNDTDETRLEMGDPMHSQPVLLNYADGSSVVFLATNEGYLHAIDTETGEERWAWIPQELLKNLHDFFQNPSTRNRPYGLDGGIVSWVDDTDKDGLIDPGEKAYLYLGMRRGGSSYYALDVSNRDDPEFLWRIAGGSETVDTDMTTADGDFEELGQTWSKPVKTRVVNGGDGDEVDVLIFAGGYDTNQDPSPPSATDADDDPTAVNTRAIDGIGRTIFIVDATTGEELWQVPTGDPAFADMQYSIPSDVRVIDIDFDGLADQVHVGDMGGQLWRFDFDNDRSMTKSLGQRISGGRIALLAGDAVGHDRRFYHAPDVSLISVGGRQQLAISIGSGWRAHPLDTDTEDRFYSIRSNHVYGPPLDTAGNVTYPEVYDDHTGSTFSGFSDVTADAAPDPADIVRGWWIDLSEGVGGEPDAPGAKVLASSVTADGQLVFTSYQPGTDVGACAAAVGSSRVWAVNVLNGTPTYAFSNGATPTLGNRSRALNQAGLAGAISVHFPETGEATVMVGTEKLDDIDIGALRRRTFWQEMIEGGRGG